jgi:hypothetical protein
MQDAEFVTNALTALEELISACVDFQLAGAQDPKTPFAQLGPFQVVKSQAAKAMEFAASRLDDLCVRYLRTSPGEWSDQLIEALSNPVQLDRNDDYENALRARYNELLKLAIILRNDAREVTRFATASQTQTAGYRPSTELSCIVFELNNPPNDLPAKRGELLELANPFDEARRPWLPILKEHIGKFPSWPT